ncbi:MAG: lytic transglycosylase [Mycobacteriales bacterium]
MRHVLPRLAAVCKVAVAVTLLAALTTAAVPGWQPYRVRPGDTLWGLARRHHTTVATLAQANHVAGSLIYAGALLLVPAGGGPPVGPKPVAERLSYYLVRPGDTLTAVAIRFHTTLAVLARQNHLTADLQIDIGQRLMVPYQVATAPAFAGRFEPSESAVETLVASEARRLGVDPALALAVAYQESGFQEAVVSHTGAVGVMQIEPATARWLSSLVGRPLDMTNAQDNVFAGVTLLHLLLRVANVRDAVAGYYQGLGSVLLFGMSRDTRHYVADVLALRARFR